MRVDGTMPTDYDGRLRYAKAPEGELWPAIVEKAYAKFKGGYGAIGSGGSPDDFVFALTGQESSVRWVSLASAQSTFERLKAALDARHVVTVATMPELLRPKGLKLEGLDALHVWFVSRVFESEGQKFVELADPMPSVATRVSTPRGILKLNRHGKMTFTIDEFKAGFPFAFITRPER